ncbi:MAG: helix-turn-helix transcriptional regulator [Pseudomonadota bacterium]
MTASVFTKRYQKFRELLILYRNQAGLTQTQLADRLKKPQSFVSKYENGERRLDLVEFLEIADYLQLDPCKFIRKLLEEFES